MQLRDIEGVTAVTISAPARRRRSRRVEGLEYLGCRRIAHLAPKLHEISMFSARQTLHGSRE